MSDAKKAKIFFREELSHIQKPGIRDFTLMCFEKLTASYFWDFTASSTQTHHPKVSNKEHGLVLHTKLAVWWGRHLAERSNVRNLDVIVSALLLHDLQKFGKILDENKKPTLAEYLETHGPLLAVQIENIYHSMNVNDEIKKDIKSIITCVAWHMGRWTNKSLSSSWKIKESEKERMGDEKMVEIRQVEIVQLADFAASRKVDAKLEELDSYKFLEV
jgi:hypothetical protein